MLAPERLLRDLETLLSSSFKDAIVWEQRDADLLGKYVYIKYDGKEVGIFMGYQIGQSGSLKGGITFFFAHPASAAEEAAEMRRLFHRLLIKLNLTLRVNPYKIVSGRSPAIIRMACLSEKDVESGTSQKFFMESVKTLTSSEPLYKAASR